jgi:hypothetical protein
MVPFVDTVKTTLLKLLMVCVTGWREIDEEAGAGLTVRVAALLSVVPAPLVTATVYDPVLPADTLPSEKVALVAPLIALLLKYHW